MVKQITENCSFIFGSSDIKSLPDELIPEIAFAGRSNVGKSSLINLLVKSKKAARVSSKPGCTRQINFYSVSNNKYRLVDLPGYGYSYAHKQLVLQYLSLTEYYLLHRRNLKKVFVLVDSKVGLKEIDQSFILWLTYNNINFHVILTKVDKVGAEGLDLTRKNIEKWMNSVGIMQPIDMISIRTKSNVLKQEINRII